MIKLTILVIKKKIIILCQIHNEFKQTPIQHLKGHGCKACSVTYIGNLNKKPQHEFIEQAIKIHGNKYNYDKVNYVNNSTKVIIYCEKHGEFLQTPGSHLSKSICPTCDNESRKQTREGFITNAINIHGNKYIYDKVEYINNTIKVILICPIHKEFKQTPNSHISAKTGCPKCAIIKKYSNVQIRWLNLMEKLHNCNIQHAENDIEFIIPETHFKADGYCKETNTIYEFYGDYWHGNPKQYNPTSINKNNKKTFEELYNKTIQRENKIKSKGYNLITIWESDWNMLNLRIRIFQKQYKLYMSKKYR